MGIKRKFIAFVAAASLLAFAAACGAEQGGAEQGGAQNGPPQEGVALPDAPDGNGETADTGGAVVLPSRISVDIGDGPLQLPYVLDGGNGPVEWSSNYSSIAVVDKNGKLYPVTEGVATVTAKTSSHATTFEVNVTDEYGSYTKIGTVEEFEKLAASKAYAKSTAKICLANDIDFGGKTIQPLGGWNDDGNAFRGVFDGRGYALKNFKIVRPESCKEEDGAGGVSYFGVSLFPNVTTGVIRNLSLVNAVTEGTGFTGGIAGKLESGLIENCYVSGSVTAAEGFAESVPAGGICGIMGAKAVVKDVFLNADVLGGFVFAGFNFGTGSNCVARESAVTALRNGETLLLCTDDTGKGGEEGKAENAQLKTFDPLNSVALKDTELTSLENYPFTERSNWAIMDGYAAFVARADGTAPDWAKSTVT